mgnify:CR=1 FL=1
MNNKRDEGCEVCRGVCVEERCERYLCCYGEVVFFKEKKAYEV